MDKWRLKVLLISIALLSDPLRLPLITFKSRVSMAWSCATVWTKSISNVHSARTISYSSNWIGWEGCCGLHVLLPPRNYRVKTLTLAFSPIYRYLAFDSDQKWQAALAKSWLGKRSNWKLEKKKRSYWTWITLGIFLRWARAQMDNQRIVRR